MTILDSPRGADVRTDVLVLVFALFIIFLFVFLAIRRI